MPDCDYTFGVKEEETVDERLVFSDEDALIEVVVVVRVVEVLPPEYSLGFTPEERT